VKEIENVKKKICRERERNEIQKQKEKQVEKMKD